MKINIHQINPKCGDTTANGRLHSEKLKHSPVNALNVFPFSSLSGSPLQSLLEYDTICMECETAEKHLRGLPCSYILGLPKKTASGTTHDLRLYHSAAPSVSATQQNVSSKISSPFASGNGFQTVNIENETITFGFYTDIASLFEHPACDSRILILFDDTPFDIEKNDIQEAHIQTLIRNISPICTILIRRFGGEGGLLFEGNSKVYNQQGAICAEAPYFQESTLQIDTHNLVAQTPLKTTRIAILHDAIVMGIRDYFHKNNLPKAFLGLSGGIDSALVVVLAVEALGKENVIGILLPSSVSTEHSVTDAEQSAQNLHIAYSTIPIESTFDSLLTTLRPLFKNMASNVAEENLQARLRGIVLMALANKFGGALVNTSNKSEAAVGYGTLYGDMCGAIAPIADLYKSEVWEMARYINRAEEIIPTHSITKPPSAELRIGQKDTDSLPDYAVLDAILYDYLENNFSREQLLEKGYDNALIDRTIRMVKTSEWKRRQAAPPIKVAKRTFGWEIFFPLA